MRDYLVHGSGKWWHQRLEGVRGKRWIDYRTCLQGKAACYGMEYTSDNYMLISNVSNLPCFLLCFALIHALILSLGGSLVATTCFTQTLQFLRLVGETDKLRQWVE